MTGNPIACEDPISISIIIPCRNEEAAIADAVASIREATCNLDVEIIACDGASTDRTPEILADLQARHGNLRVLANARKTVPHAMNLAIKEAKGEIIFRVDAHATYPPHYFRVLAEELRKHDAACTGGTIITEVKATTPMARTIRAVLGDTFGVGNSHFRTGASAPCQVDTVPFGCYPRWVFQRFGDYNELLIRNQDIELNKRILRGGGTIWLIPEVQATYYARHTLGAFLGNQFQNGRWNILTIAITGCFSSVSPRHLVPAIFTLAIALPLLLAPFAHELAWLAILPLLPYLPVATWRAWKLPHDEAPTLLALFTYLTLHLAYGAGSIIALFEVAAKRHRRNA